MTVTLFVLYLRPTHRQRFQTWAYARLDWKRRGSMLYFARSMDLRAITAWLSVDDFLILYRAAGEDAMAITNIVWPL